MVTRSDKLAMIGPSLADLVLEIFCFAASPSFRGVATLVSKARQTVKDAGSSSPELAREHSNLGKHITDVLTNKVKAARQQRLDLGVDVSLLTQAETAVAALISTDAEQDLVVLSAVRDPAGFENYLRTRAAKHRQQIEEQAEPYFDALVRAVAAAYVEIAPWSDSFVVIALKSLLGECTDIKEQLNASQIDNRQLFNQILQILQSLTEAIEALSKPSHTERVNFGSRPDVVTDKRFVERGEQEQLNALITDPTQRRTVLVGMRGCGKTQLAASLAKQCEEANWSIVAWLNAVSRDSIQSDLVELAKQLGIGTSDLPTQDEVIRRCLNHLQSVGPADRLIVFDNVENIDDLRGLVPRGNGLRVVVTTTNNTGWGHQGWDTIKVGVFDRERSINYLLTATESTDHDAADTVARRLGDLPLALAQAAATALDEDWTLTQYLRLLEKYRSEQVIRSIPGDEYPHDVYGALRMAIRGTLNNLDEGTRHAARRQLGALALLAESGVPTRWLDPMSEEPNDAEFQDHDRAADEDAHKALTKLIRRSIVQQSADRATTMLHRLQAQAFRESWDEIEAAVANHAAAQILTEVNIDGIALADTERRRKNTRDLMHQLRSIGTQTHSFSLFKQSGSLEATDHAMRNAILLGIEREIIKLHDVVDILSDIYGIHNETVQILRNDLADAYLIRGSMSMARKLRTARKFGRIMTFQGDIDDAVLAHMTEASEQESAHNYYEAIEEYKLALQACPPAIGIDARYIATIRHALAWLYSESNRIEDALAEYKKAIEEGPAILGPGHPSTDRLRVELANLLSAEGRFTDAIQLLNEAYSNYSNTFGNADDLSLHTLIKLCDAHVSIGEYDKALALYKKVLETQPPIQLSNISKQFLQHRLAEAYASAGQRKAAVTLLDSMLEELHKQRRDENSESINHDYYINDLYSIEYQLASILCESEKVDDLVRATTILHGTISYSKLTWGPQHPKTIEAADLLSEVSTRISNLSAITNDL